VNWWYDVPAFLAYAVDDFALEAALAARA